MAYVPTTALGADAAGFSLSWSGTSSVGSTSYDPSPGAEAQARADFAFRKAQRGALAVYLKRGDGTILDSYLAPTASTTSPNTSSLQPLPGAAAAGGGLTTAGMVAVGLGALGLFYLVVR